MSMSNQTDDVPPHIVVVALRRSGTTAFWKILRQDKTYVCYDEPFNPWLSQIPDVDRKSAREEFVALHNSDTAKWKAMFAPILRRQEVTPGFTDDQKAYLKMLMSQGPTVIDVTRCHAKMAELSQVIGPVVVVHLYRRPAAFVSSHMLPSDSTRAVGLRKMWARWTFFRNRNGGKKWGMQELMSPALKDVTAPYFKAVDVTYPDHTEKSYVKLLAFWLASFRRAEADGRTYFGDKFLSVSFEDFCENPQKVLDQVYQKAGRDTPLFDLKAIKPAAPPFENDAPEWKLAAQKAGFSSAEKEALF